MSLKTLCQVVRAAIVMALISTLQNVSEVRAHQEKSRTNDPACQGQIDSNNHVVFVLQDANLNVVALSDIDDFLLEQYAYEPYGVLVSAENFRPHAVNRIGHQGLFFERFDGAYSDLTVDVTNAGLYYNRNRFYSPTLGRFIQRDPNESALPIMAAMAMNGESWSIVTGGLDAQALYGDGMNLYAYRCVFGWSGSNGSTNDHSSSEIRQRFADPATADLRLDPCIHATLLSGHPCPENYRPIICYWDRLTGEPKPAIPRPTPDLRVLTFNVQQFEGCEGGVEKIGQFLSEQRADLICLQEAHLPKMPRNNKAIIDKVSTRTKLEHTVSRVTLGIPDDQACDLAILSRWPIRKSFAHTLGQRGWVYAIEGVIDVAGTHVHVFNLHMHATWRLLDKKHVEESIKTRRQQVEALKKLLADIHEPVIVAGDLNAAEGSDEYKSLIGTLLDFAGGQGISKATLPAQIPVLRFDYILGSASFKARSYEVLNVKLSDHRPVVAEIELPHTK